MVVQRIFYFIILIFLFVPAKVCLGAQETNVDSTQHSLDAMPDDTVKVNMLINLSENAAWSDVRSAERYATQALKLSEKLKFEKGLAYSKFRLSEVFIDSDYKITEDLILESLEHAMAIRDSLLIARIYNAIGSLKDNLRENEDALEYYKKSLTIFLKMKNDSLASAVYNNLAIIYQNMGNDSLSEAYYLIAADINKRSGNDLWLAINYLNIGYNLITNRKLEKGKRYMDQSMELVKKNNFRRVLPYLYNNYSYYYFLLNDFQMSISFAQDAAAESKEQSNLLQERLALTHLKNAYMAINDLSQAIDYADQISNVSDSINKYNKLKEIDLLEMRHEFERERKQQALERELLRAEIQRNKLTLILIIVGSGLGIIIVLFLYFLQHNRFRRKTLEQKAILLEKEKLEQQLEFKNKELTTNVMYLLKKNEFISSISSQLKTAKQDEKDDKKKVIDKIILALDRSISEDNWTDFEVRFQEVHVGFYNKLNNQFPDLTPNELRLCAFLRLNMTSKEIAGITYQSPESLKIARYRLRKKLGLERDENLVAFLTKI